MTIFLILAPYGAFSLLMLATSATVSLFASAAICLMVVAYDILGGRSIKMLGAGSAVLFAALGGYLVLIDPGLANSAVKLTIDTGVLAISLASMAIRRPFTLQYAFEAVDAETAGGVGVAGRIPKPVSGRGGGGIDGGGRSSPSVLPMPTIFVCSVCTSIGAGGG